MHALLEIKNNKHLSYHYFYVLVEH